MQARFLLFFKKEFTNKVIYFMYFVDKNIKIMTKNIIIEYFR